MLDNVSGYDPKIPKGRFNFAVYRWMNLFIFDWIFNFTRESDQEGKQVKKMDSSSFAGRNFKKLHDLNVKKLLKYNDGVEYNSTIPLPSIEAKDFNKAFFQFWKKKVNMPIVVKGFLNNASIIEDASPENFTKNYGEMEVKCVLNKVQDDSKVGQNIETSMTNLADFLTNEKYKDYYINNFYGILDDNDFTEKCRGDEIDLIQGQKNVLTQWFISRFKGSGSFLHCAGGDNMFLNIKGKKEWYFIDPTYTPVVKPALSEYAIYAISELTEALEGNFHENIIDEYPFMKKVPVYKCLLEEGDILFNPPFWWHSVRNMTEYTVGCATRYLSSTVNSWTFLACILYDALRNPVRSNLPQTMKMIKDRNTRKNMIDSIFSKNKEEVNNDSKKPKAA